MTRRTRAQLAITVAVGLLVLLPAGDLNILVAVAAALTVYLGLGLVGADRRGSPGDAGGRSWAQWAPRGAGRRSTRFAGDPRSPARFGIEELARRLGLTVEELRAARPAYARHLIPKRTGGTRPILAPDAPTKALQRRILRRLLARVPVHPACHGFERGRSIVSNAAPHARHPVVLRLDLEDFFGSTSARRVRRLYRVLGWDREAATILTRLTTHGGGLPQGAPTSPRLANLVNVLLDARLDGLARVRGATYTRYADDLTFSFAVDDADAIHNVIRATKRFVREDGYRLHEGRKLRIRRRHERQLVTGLVVNDRLALPRARRRWLRAVEHRLSTRGDASISREQLTGWHAFELMVESAATSAAASAAPAAPAPPGRIVGG